MKNLFYLFFALSLTSCVDKKNNLTDAQGLNLNGDVKSVHVYEFDIEEKFGEEVEINVVLKDYILFNELGNKTENITPLISDTLVCKSEYDNNNNEVLFLTYYKKTNELSDSTIRIYDDEKLIKALSYDKEGNLKSTTHSKYDKNGNRIEWARYDKDGNLDYLAKDYIYDESSNLIEYSDYNEEGKLNQVYKYKYDDGGNILDYSRYFSNGNLSIKMKFNKNGKQAEVKFLDLEGNVTTEEKYDENGNIVNRKFYFDSHISETNYTYLEFDEKQNWTRRHEIKKGGALGSRKKYSKREVRYY
tara:strand:+ start:758 stop:1663 length:906 start_codon:yes stop_codon:yes gene_type:complete